MSRTMTKEERIEARKAKALELQDILTKEVENLYNSENWQRYLDCLGRMHSYSFRNIMLMQSQCPNVSAVAGYRRWATMGYQVKKGEKAIKIFGYAQKTYEEEVINENGQKDTEKVTREYYPIVNVFDYSQVENVEGEDYFALPKKVWGDVNTDDPKGLYETITAYLTKSGWTVQEVDDLNGARGVTHYATQKINILAGRSRGDQVKTLLHEAAHAYLHRDATCSRNQKECEAESVAYCVAGALGIDTSAASIGYVTGWLPDDPDSLQDCAQNIRTAVHHILTELEKEDD